MNTRRLVCGMQPQPGTVRDALGCRAQVWTVWRHNDTILETRYRIVVPDHAHAVSMRDGWEATGSNTSEQVHRWLAARVGEVDRVKDKPLESHFAKALIKESDVAQDDVSDVSKARRSRRVDSPSIAQP